MSVQLMAGTSEVRITPPPGCQMIHRRAEGIHDDLFARTVAFELGGERAAIVGLDLIGLAREQVEAIRRQTQALCGLEASGLMLCCSHTHSGPVTNCFRGWGRPDPRYVDGMVEKVARCVSGAFGRLAPAALAWGEWPVQIGFNRRLDGDGAAAVMAPDSRGPVDQAVRAVRVSDPRTNTVRAVLFSHGCHAVVIHRSTHLVSSDYPGQAAEVLKERLGKDVCPVFAQGCGGDANTEVLDGTFDDRGRIGTTLGLAAAQAAERAEPIECKYLRTMQATLRVPTRIPTAAEAREALELNRARLRQLIEEGADPGMVADFREWGLEWAEDLVRVAASLDEDNRLQMEITAFVLGDELYIVGLGAEAFHKYQSVCRAVSPGARTMVLAYVNGVVNYLPTAAEFARRGYETVGSGYVDTVPYAYKRYGTLAFTPECEAAVREAVREMLARKEDA